ncbi:unnamed protein product [Calypogeia fissa]
MSSAEVFILSTSVAAIQTRYLSPAVVAKERLRCGTEGDRMHHRGASTSLQAHRFQARKLDRLSSRNRSATAANAGLGRYSGSVHGNPQRKSRSRRRPPAQQEYCEEAADEHEDGKIGSDSPLTTQDQEDQSDESTAGAEECEALAVAEGVISKDGLCGDDESQRLSYNRYLLEIGVSPWPRDNDTKSEQESKDFLRELHGMGDESSSDTVPQLSDEGDLRNNELLPVVDNEAGRQESLGYEGTMESDTKPARDPESGGGNFAEKSDLDSEKGIESESESISVSQTSSVDATVLPAPERKFSPANEDDKNFSGDDGQATDRFAEAENGVGLRSGSDGGPVKKKRRKKAKSKAVVEPILIMEERRDDDRVRASSGGAERPAIRSDKEVLSMNGSFKASKEDEISEDFGTGESPEDVAIGKSTSEFSEPKMDFGTGESPGEVASVKSTSEFSEPKMDFGTGESPEEVASVKSTLEFSEPKMDFGTGESPEEVASVKSTLEFSEPKMDFETGESPEEVASVKSTLEFSSVAVSADTGGQSPMALVTVPDSNSMIDINNEDKSSETPLDILGKVGSQVVETVLEKAVQTAAKVVPVEIASKVVELPVVVVEQAAQVASKVAELPVAVVEQAAQVGGQVVEILPDVDVVTEQVEQVAETVASTASQVAEQVTNGVDTVASTAAQVVDQVTEFFTSDEDDDTDSDDEFESYVTSDLPEFRGKAGLQNFVVKQEAHGFLSILHDIYTYMLKQSFPQFAAAMFSAPILVSGIFTLLYLPEFEGLAFDDTARDFFAAGGDSLTLQVSWGTVFQVFMFSLSLSTGLQPELAPLSPYTLIVANLNALVAQLVFVFLSGAVFARLSQPSQPLRCSTVALVSTSPAQRRRKESGIKVFMARYVLAGPQPCELVDVKVDLTYKYNTHTRTGSYFRATQPLKLATHPLRLIRADAAFLTHGMLVRHVIDENSPLHQRTPETLKEEDGIFCFTVFGLERASTRSVFHVQHYSVVDNDVIWDAEFEDMVLINKKNERVIDHSRLSMWKFLTN